MNLVLARSCSNSCAYCFESTERESGRQNFISMENVTLFAQWARYSNLSLLSLLGGEPFLHPELSNIVKIFRQISPGTGLRILTGGVFKNKLLDGLPPNEVGLMFNVNEPEDYKNAKHFNKVINNIETAINKGFKVILGFNVWREDFDPSFIPNLAYRMGQSNFRWTIANPQLGTSSNVLHPSQFSTISKKVFKMLQRAAELELEAVLDCPIPLCFFSESELAWVRQYHQDTAAGMGHCYPVVDVTPELEAIRCFALSSIPRVKITDFPNEGAIQNWFIANVDSQLVGQGCFSYCPQCPHFKGGRCLGGCLAWQKGNIKLKETPVAKSVADSMQQAIDNGDPDSAIKLYEASNHWIKTDLTTYEAARAAFSINDHRLALRYAQKARDLSFNPEVRGKINNLIAGLSFNSEDVDNHSRVKNSSHNFTCISSHSNSDLT